MNSTTIYIKNNYLSEFISELPENCILNKGITGCGGTTVELQSKRNSIILCPTRNLVTSKSNDKFLGVDGKVSKKDITDYLKNGLPFKKIVATYDALPKIMESIPDYSDYFLLVDEYHLLFNDYSLRGKAIQFILNNYSKFKKYCFMTATPLKEEFILKELSELPKINYVWEKAIPVNIHIKDTYFIQKTILEFIDTFKNKNLHIFLNSVATIHNLVKNLSEDSFRVVCSENSKTKISNFEKINSPVKKFNFYTSCAFEGCDIYDPDGVCIIVCDTNISTTVLDIATKIRQVCGRLRDSKYKDEVYLILNTSKHRYAGTTKDEFEKRVQESEEDGKLWDYKIHHEFSQRENEIQLKLYNKEKFATLYLNKYEGDIFYDENLKKMDLYNYNLISEIYNNSISVMKECNNNSIITKKETSVSNNSYLNWIQENITKSEYTYSELESTFSPLFMQHNMKWNKKTSISHYFPPHVKKRKTKNGIKEVYYIFNNF